MLGCAGLGWMAVGCGLGRLVLGSVGFCVSDLQRWADYRCRVVDALRLGSVVLGSIGLARPLRPWLRSIGLV